MNAPAPHAPPDHAKGLMLGASAALCWSSGGIFVRLIQAADGWTIVFWRSVFMSLAVGLYLGFRYRSRAPEIVKAVGWPGLLSACLLTAAFIFYILSVTKTAVANIAVVMSAAPLVAALLAWPILREKPDWRAMAAIFAALAGVAFMFTGKPAVVANIDPGSIFLGNALALGIAISFGANIVVVRKNRKVDMVPSMFLAGLICAAVTFPLATPLAPTARDFAFLVALGFFQLGLGLYLFTRGSRHLSAAEIGLLGLLESVCSPLWVWLFLGETPTPQALAGGALVLTALTAHVLVAARRQAGP